MTHMWTTLKLHFDDGPNKQTNRQASKNKPVINYIKIPIFFAVRLIDFFLLLALMFFFWWRLSVQTKFNSEMIFFVFSSIFWKLVFFPLILVLLIILFFIRSNNLIKNWLILIQFCCCYSVFNTMIRNSFVLIERPLDFFLPLSWISFKMKQSDQMLNAWWWW